MVDRAAEVVTGERVTGLMMGQTASTPSCDVGKSGVKKKSIPTRTGLLWTEGVKVMGNEKSNTPSVLCLWCGKQFSGGITRIREHFLGGGVISVCACEKDDFCVFKEKLEAREQSRVDAKAHKKLCNAVDKNVQRPHSFAPAMVAEATPTGDDADQVRSSASMLQRNIKNMLNGPVQDAEVEDAIAEFFYANSIPFSIASCPSFKKLLLKAMCASANFKPPTEAKLANGLLNKTVHRLRTENEPMISNMVDNGLTIVSDGWDDVERNHLINFLLCSNSASIFDGTIELSTNEHEDATTVAKFIIEAIERAGELNVIQVCTDTCATMKAAWRIIEAKFPWITCTPCAAHCLSLLLKDFLKIGTVAKLLDNARAILNRFCGHQRWPRKRLREVR